MRFNLKSGDSMVNRQIGYSISSTGKRTLQSEKRSLYSARIANSITRRHLGFLVYWLHRSIITVSPASLISEHFFNIAVHLNIGSCPWGSGHSELVQRLSCYSRQISTRFSGFCKSAGKMEFAAGMVLGKFSVQKRSIPEQFKRRIVFKDRQMAQSKLDLSGRD